MQLVRVLLVSLGTAALWISNLRLSAAVFTR
jgi:hypothetical protein